MTDGAPIHTVVGGLHLWRADGQRLNATLDGLRRAGVDQLVVGHCTGAGAEEALQVAWGDDFRELTTGMKFTL
jgi:7,8-dihydropterin-6-yl-methyl-4-(beta-D-ribofuranosyl)aminobenzene 5'-phosphate synthase